MNNQRPLIGNNYQPLKKKNPKFGGKDWEQKYPGENMNPNLHVKNSLSSSFLGESRFETNRKYQQQNNVFST
jgi:hypothetical protein